MRARHLLVGFLVCAVAAGCGGGALKARGIAQVRAISAVSNPARIDVFTDFNLIAIDLTNGEGAPYGSQSATELNFGVRQFGSTQTLASGTFTADVNQKYTVFAYQTGANTAGVRVTSDSVSLPGAAKFKLRLVHLHRFVDAVDVYFVDTGADISQATPVIQNMSFPLDSAYVELDAGIQKDIVVTLAGTTNVVVGPLTLTPPEGALRTLMLFDNAGPSLNIYND